MDTPKLLAQPLPQHLAKPLALLGGLSPQVFMKRHWQKKPLLIRQAVPELARQGPLLDRSALFDLAAEDDVESRLIVQNAGKKGWQLKQGPFARRALPPLKTPGWTLLVQGVDLQVQALRGLMDQFRFLPDARLDDVMISYASDGGGVGPHFDSYDVFLLQAQGTRRWHISRQKDLSLQAGAPLKILQNFEPEQSFDLVAGDMLYLPPKWAHDGVAVGECMTYSIGFRAPGKGEMARELLQRLADDAVDEIGGALYTDGKQVATENPGQIPQALQAFAQQALLEAVANPRTQARALGESLTEPKSSVWFDTAPPQSPRVAQGAKQAARHGGGDVTGVAALRGGIFLDRRTKMLYDDWHVFINGESFSASGRDATLMRQLADQRELAQAALTRASVGAKSLLQDWLQAGWIHGLGQN